VAFINDVFPKANFSASSLTAKRGFSYRLIMFCPVNQLNLPDTDFRKYWIKTNIDFDYTKQGNDTEALSDRLVIGVPDGWLAKWPGPEAPPPNFVKQFHLEPDGPDKFRNFTILGMIQNKIANDAAAKWHGTAEIPDY
jgi:hypothetical protein